MLNDYLSVSAEVSEALQNNKPVVALESTIISHGMPWPENVKTAMDVEQVVREEGAVPATIAIMDGKCMIGLDREKIELLGQSKGVWKVSLRDMPYVISQKIYGATTVAATMRIASLAGIKVFATGGIGGVHRGAATTMDISADLTEMAVTNVAIVSAGVKSILDIGLTLEYLETMGIPVVTYGQNEFPSFYSTVSGFLSPLRMDQVSEIAKMLAAKWEMGLNGSALIANPIPAAYEVPNQKIEAIILDALRASEDNKVTGKSVTPFLLKHIADHSKGESLEANIALIKNNAKLAARIAKAFNDLKYCD